MLRKKEKSIRIEIGKKDMELCGKEVKHCWQVKNCILLPVEVADQLVDTQQIFLFLTYKNGNYTTEKA